MAKRGPNTTFGKATSSRNAVRHGLRSEAAVIPGESENDWRRHLEGIFDACQPEGYLEEEITRLIALSLWRRWRLERYETAMTQLHLNNIPDDALEAARYAEKALKVPIEETITEDSIGQMVERRILPPDDVLDRTMRYRAAEHRQFLQLLHELEALQARRRGERSPLARFDFSVSPAQ